MELNTKFIELNRMGLIPGPDETIAQFQTRVDYCLNLKDKLDDELKSLFDDNKESYSQILQPSCIHLSKFADLNPTWTMLLFSNIKLAPWHGGCAWIFQMSEESPTGALIQLRKTFLYSTHFLGIYARDELLRHELVHLSRMMYEEPVYEELLAYQTSNSAFRRWFGPILRSSAECLLFVLLLGTIILADFFILTSGYPEALKISLWLKVIPLGLIFLAIGRLYFAHRNLNLCFDNLLSCLNSEKKARAILYRLRDCEIESFAKMSKEQLLSYAALQKEKELRWSVLYHSYFNDSSSI